jgi:hypothetical protein
VPRRGERDRQRRRAVADGGVDLRLGDEHRLRQPRPADVGRAQVRAEQVGERQVGAAQVRADEVGAAQARAAQRRAPQVTADEIDAGPVRADLVAAHGAAHPFEQRPHPPAVRRCIERQEVLR